MDGRDSATVSSSLPGTAQSFLFVCFGNIMRSPMCEALMKRALAARSPEFKVLSAGLSAVPGRKAHPWAVSAAAELGISLDEHRARLLTDEMVDCADLIFVMDFQNWAEMHSRFPAVKQKVHMLGIFRSTPGNFDPAIQDPYHLGEEATKYCYRLLDTCIANLARRIPIETMR